MNSSRKGSRGELELLHLLEGQGLACHRNDQRYIGGKNNPDISLIINGQRYHVECKRKERLKALISSIPDPIDRELFRMRYIKGDTWAKIECTLPYCRAQLYKRHRKQLDCWRDAGLLTK